MPVQLMMPRRNGIHSAAIAALAVMVLGIAHVAAAADERSAWQFEVQPYAWISGMYGTVEVDGVEAEFDVTTSDLLNAVFDGDALAAGGYLSATRGRWTLFTDAFGGGAKVKVDQVVTTPFCDVSVRANATATFVITDFAVGYEIGRWAMPRRARPVTLGVYAGARYVHLGNDLSGGVAVIGGQQYGGDVSDTQNFADPIIGLRWSVPVLDAVSLTFRGDVGGFGASSTLDWGLVGDVRYWMSWHPFSTQPYVAAGYRVVAIDRSPDAAAVDMQVRGPLAGMGFLF